MNIINIITNNPKVCLKYNNVHKITFVEGSYMDVLVTTRDFVHRGHELLTHPLSGSVKPNETPYKSVMISDHSQTMVMDSLMIIEDSIATTRKFLQMKDPTRWPEAILEDFREIDLNLLESAIQSAT